MSGPFGAGALNFFSGAAEFYPYTIDQSVRFNGGDSPYLSRTPSSAGNKKTWTWSGWIKRSSLQSASPYGGFGIIFAGGNEQNMWAIPANCTLIAYWINSEQLAVIGTGNTTLRLTTARQRDLSGWYHFVVAMDTTQASANDRTKIYINGVQQTSFDTTNNVAQNTDLNINEASNHFIGGQQTFNAAAYMNMYLAETHFIDGQALTASSFGETKAGIWVPKDYTGSYGTNGFKLAFQDSASLGDDTSGNGNDFTSSGLASTDQMLDSPTNNHPTINGLQPHGSILSDGNLTMDNNNRVVPVLATMGVSSGKWAWKVTINTQDAWGIGISTAPRADDNSGGLGYVSYEYSYDTWDGDKRNNNTQSSYGVSVSSGGNVEVLLDLDAGTLSFKANGSDQGTAYSGLSGTFFPAFANWAASTGAGDTIDVDFGQGGYTPPSGYELLNAANLPDPGIDPAEDEAPTDYFNTVLYTGDGSTSNAITGVGFSPNFVWIKKRGPTAASNRLLDTVRGVQKNIYSDAGTAEETQNSIMSFDSDGFTLGDSNGTNQSTHTFVSWNWKAGGAAVSNTDGTITSSVSASPESGMSILTYTGPGSSGGTIGHGLGKKPSMIIVKNRSATESWRVYHSDLTATKYLNLNATGAAVTSSAVWADTEPTASVFSVANDAAVSGSGNSLVAYCFADIDGMVKAGSYTGNGSSDGPMVHTGFRPAWVMIKATGSTGGASNWRVVDSVRNTFNPEDKHLQPNTTDAEDTGSGAGYIDFLSNGFKIRATALQLNSSGVQFVYLAFAEQSLKYANAR
jgi:hypothetical protein